MWTKARVLATRKEVEGMNEKQLYAHLEEWSNSNYGHEYGKYPLIPTKHVIPDCLHMFMDHYNCTARNAIHHHLLAEDYSDKDLKNLAAGIRDSVNERCRGWSEQGGSGLLLEFGLKDKRNVLNGPKMKALAHDPDLLQDLLKLMKPLYDLMEAKDHPSIRRQAISAAEQQTEAEAEAARVAAALQAAAGLPEEPVQPRGRGQKKKSKRGAHLNKNPKPKRMRAVVVEAERGAAEEEEHLEEEEGGGGVRQELLG